MASRLSYRIPYNEEKALEGNECCDFDLDTIRQMMYSIGKDYSSIKQRLAIATISSDLRECIRDMWFSESLKDPDYTSKDRIPTKMLRKKDTAAIQAKAVADIEQIHTPIFIPTYKTSFTSHKSSTQKVVVSPSQHTKLSKRNPSVRL